MNTQRRFQISGVLALTVFLALTGCGSVNGRGSSAAVPTTPAGSAVSDIPATVDNPDTFADLLVVGLTEASKAR